MKNLIKTIGRGITPLVLTGALALTEIGCAGNTPDYQPKPIEQKPKVTTQSPAQKPAKQETDVERFKREIREYVARNKINLSVLEKGEELTDMYYLGETDRNQVVITNYASPAVVELDGLLRRLERVRINNHSQLLKRGDFSDPFADIEETAKDAEYMVNCFDRGCNGTKKYSGKQDHMITGKEARVSARHLRQYFESRTKQEEQIYQAKLAQIQRRK